MEQSTTGEFSRPSIVWCVALAPLCCLILAYGSLYSKNTTGDFAYLTGYNLGSALALWGIFHLLFGRKTGSVATGIAYGLIYVCLMISSYIGYERNVRAMNETLSSVQKDLTAFINASTDAQGLPKQIEKPIDMTPTVTGKMGEVQKWTKRVLSRNAEVHNAYLDELNATGWAMLLDADRLKADATFNESFSILEKGKGVVQKYKAKTVALLDVARNDIKTLDLPEDFKLGLAQGYDMQLSENREHLDTIWGLEEKAAAQFENIIKLLAAKKGKWIVQDHRILFASQEDLNAFNSYLEKADQLAQQQQLLQQRRDELTLARLEKLKQ